MPFPYAIGSSNPSPPSDRLSSSDLLGELVSGSRGGLAATAPHSPSGGGPLLEMLYISDGSAVCGGLIGSQRLLCADTGCSIQSHRVKRWEIGDSSLFIVAPPSQGRRTTALYSDPSLSGVDIPEDLMEWLAQSKTLEMHRRSLTLLGELSATERLSVNLEDFVESVSRTGAVGKTPAPRKRQFSDMFDSLDSDAVLLTDQMTLSPVLNTKFEGGSDYFLEENWPKLQSGLSSLSRTLTHLSKTSEERMPELVIQINEIDAALLSLKGAVGAWNENRSSASYGATLFSIVDGLSEAVSELEKSLTLVREGSVNPKLGVKVDALARAVKEVRDVSLDPSTGVGSIGNAVKDLAIWSQKVDLRLVGLEMTDTNQGPDFMDRDMGVAPQESTADLRRVEQLEDRVDLLEEAATSGSSDFEINDLVFKRPEEVFDWLSEQGPAGAVASGWIDIFSLADFAGMGTSFKEQLADRKRVCDSKLQVEGSEILVLASFGPEYPSVFGEASDATDTVPLPKAKDFRTWYNSDENSSCVYQQWRKAASSYKTQIFNAELKKQAWRGEKAQRLLALAEQFQLRTNQFLTQLQASITTFYDKMVEEDKTPPGEAWLLVSRMLQAVFRKLAEARAVAGRPLNNPFTTLDDRMRRSARVLWGTYECHRLMHEILATGFSRHPIIIPAQTLALYSMKAGKSEVEQLTKRIKAAEDSMRPLTASDGRVSQSKVNSLENSVMALKGENKALKEILKKVEARIKVLENK